MIVTHRPIATGRMLQTFFLSHSFFCSQTLFKAATKQASSKSEHLACLSVRSAGSPAVQPCSCAILCGLRRRRPVQFTGGGGAATTFCGVERDRQRRSAAARPFNTTQDLRELCVQLAPRKCATGRHGIRINDGQWPPPPPPTRDRASPSAAAVSQSDARQPHWRS